MIVIRNVLHADGLRRAGGLFHANLACACTGSLTAAPSMAMPTSGQLNCKFCEEEAILQGRESILRPRGLSSKQRLSYTAHRQEASGPMEGKASALAALKARRQQAATAALGAGSTGGAQDSMGSEAAAEAVGTSGRAEPQGLPAGAIAPGAVARKSAKTWAWICSMCNNECVPVRTESRCLCGHRLKEHEKLDQGPGAGESCKCKSARCTCKRFFFIVAEGSWVLHCRCKHKHIDHDPVTLACRKPGCKCGTFDSPWVCNCDHPWSAHNQVVIERQYKSIEELMMGAAIDVNRHDLINRGLP